jgi:exosortase
MLHRTEVFENERGFSLGWKGRVAILGAALLVISVFFFKNTLYDLFSSVLHRVGSSHGLFVPFISGYFIWLERERIKQCELDFSLLSGGAMMLAGFFLFYASRGSTEVALPALSFFLVVSGLLTVVFGNQLLKAVAFPLFFLITMIPLPSPIYRHIGEWMRSATTAGSIWVMNLIHFPIYREGYHVLLPNTSLFIDTGCSGIRYLLSYFVFSLAYAFLFKKSPKSRVLAVLASFPIALIAGVLRLSAIYLTVYYIGAFMAEHQPHVFVSWSVFGAVLVGAIAVDQSLSRWRERKAEGRG